MFFYSWTNVSAEAEGRIEKRHRCEECGTRYSYVMKRYARASSHQPFGIGAHDAAREVRGEARHRLRLRLEDEVDPVPCPECGWLQAEMVDTMREEDFGWVRLFPLWVVLVGLLVVPAVSLLAFLFIKLADGFVAYPILLAATAIVYLLPFALVWRRGRARRSSFDPNVTESLKGRLRYARRRARVIADGGEPEPEEERPRPRRRRPVSDESDWRRD